ncbi:MAG: peptide chain release factor 1 [Pseudomonadales bacterium]
MALTETVIAKLQGLAERQEELSRLLSDPEVAGDRNQFIDFNREYSELEPLTAHYQQYQKLISNLEEVSALTSDTDREIQALAADDVATLRVEIDEVGRAIEKLLLPRDPNDGSNVFLEIRAGTGGDEAALFSGDLFRMYLRWAESKGWHVEVLNERPGDHGGFKEVISRIRGNGVYSHMKFESGAHRVQRVPETESQGRVHTSACTVAIIPEVEEIEQVTIDKRELRVDTYRSSGAGGQHVNKTDSAVRLTHIPTGIVVECQDERSQHKNRAKAMTLLQSKLLDAARNEQQLAQSEHRKSLVGSGNRSERIRTYNFPQGRLTDHRINLTLYKLDEVMEGELDQIVEPLTHEHQADELRKLSDHETV